jgi:hypothetical protein
MFSETQANAAGKPGSFGDTFRALAKLPLVVVAALAAVLAPAPSYAQYYVSAGGGGNTCSAAAPCATIAIAIASFLPNSGTVVCLSGNAPHDAGADFSIGSSVTLDIDCPLGYVQGMNIRGSGLVTLRIRHLAFIGGSSITFGSGGTLILEDCVFTESSSTPAIDLEPSAALKVVIKSSRISNNPSGILLKPAAGGSINATLDRVTIADNSGGGIKIDTTNGPVTLDIADSVVSNNGGNGINALGTGANQNIVSIKNSVIARNGVAGVQANGASAGVLVQTTLFDQNASGATSLVSGGHISTYGNNSIVGGAGSGFSGTAGPQ